MNALDHLATNQPVLFVFCATIGGFALLFFPIGIAYSKLRKPYGDIAMAAMRVVVAAGLLLLLWQLGGLESAGITVLGRWQVWLLAAGGMIYMTVAGLYAFYGKVALDVSRLTCLPAARTAVLTNVASVLHEEVLFRGLVLYVLYRAWGPALPGAIGSVVLTALLFAVPHLVAVAMGVSQSAASLLVVQACIIAIWWGALVLLGGSIWPAVLLHYVVNVVVGVQGMVLPMVAPDTLAYRRLLWFSVPLGVLGIGLLLRAAPLPAPPGSL